MESDTSWNSIPDIALVYIYCYLTDIDKLNVACACKNWYRLFDSPVLWRERRVVFGANDAERTSEKERKFIFKYGKHLRKLTLGFGTPTFKSCMTISKAVDAYVKSICSGNRVKLREIDLEHMHLEQHWHFILSRNRLISALGRLLKKQKYLDTVYLSGGRTRLHDGCRLLEALAKGPGGRTVKSLYMEDFFETNIFPWRQVRYVNAISKFMALENLHINYKYFSAEVLRNLANKLHRTLKSLSLILEGDLRGVEIPTNAWYDFTERCPTAVVNAYLCTTILRGNDLRTPFVRGIPLGECYLTSWTRYDETEVRLAALLRHLGNVCSATMVNFAMFFDCHEPVDRELLYMLGQCRHIRDLCVTCRLAPDTVIDVMKLQHTGKLRLTSLNLSILGLSDDDWARINEQKDRLLADVTEFSHVGPGEYGSSDGGSTEDGDDDDSDGVIGGVNFGDIFAIARDAVAGVDDDLEDVLANNRRPDDDDEGYLM